MIVTIHQPDFLPWLGFFDRWKKSDLYIVLDDVQFVRKGWHHRDKIKTMHGVQWLTVPVQKKGRFTQEIRETLINSEEDWQRRILNMVRHAYGHAPCFHRIYPELEEIFSRNHERLVDLNIDLLRYCAKELHIKTPLLFSSSLGVHSTGTKRLVDLVMAVKGGSYFTGMGAKEYLEENLFTEKGLSVWWQEFFHPEYHQLHGDFVPGLSVLDYLMMSDRPGLTLEDPAAWVNNRAANIS